MVPTSLRDRWREGTTTLGAWISLRDPLLAEAAALAGYDYVVVDMQHGLSDYSDVAVMVQAMARTPTVPVVRVPWNEPGIIGRVLDAGALGVIIPLVNSVEEARRAVAACRYAPDGSRSIGPLVTRVRHGAGFPAMANDVVACIPMIETRQAVEAVDEIVAVPGIDAVYIGPADLSLTYGLAPAVDQSGDPFDDCAGAGGGRLPAPRRDPRDPRQRHTRRQATRRRLPDDHRWLRRRTGDRCPPSRRRLRPRRCRRPPAVDRPTEL